MVYYYNVYNMCNMYKWKLNVVMFNGMIMILRGFKIDNIIWEWIKLCY